MDGFLFILKSAIWLAVIIFSFCHFFTFGFLYIETKIGNRRDPETFPNPKVYRYLVNSLKEFVFVSFKFILFPLRWINFTLNYDTIGQQPAEKIIVLVHGYTRSQVDWIWFRKKLKTDLPIFTVNMKPIFGNIKENSQSLAKQVKQIQDMTHCKEITVIAHSMGGLASIYYAEKLDTNNLVKKIITIGTPFDGTKIAVAGLGKNSKEMIPNSKFSKEIRSMVKASSKQYYIIASKLDNLISPWYSAILDWVAAEQQYILQEEAHLAMLYSTSVVNKINQWI